MRTKVIIFSALSMLLLSSCEGLINVDQPDVIEQYQAFDDPNSTRLSMIGLYGLMTDLVEPLFLAGEVRADLSVATNSADNYIKEYSNNSFSASNPYISPKPFYTLINNVNDFISEFEKLYESEQMDSITFMKYKAELIGIRVWSQYQVARIFGKCKYYTHVISEDSEGTITEMAYGNKLLEQLVNDLSFSDTVIFTSKTEDAIWQTIRISDYYVNYMMGELLLDMKLYKEAYDRFDEILKRGDTYNRKATTKFSFTEYFRFYEWYDELFAEDWETSSIIDHAVFMIAFDNKYNQTNELWNWTASLDYQVAPADWFITEFYTNAVLNATSAIDYRYYSIMNQDRSLDRQYAISKYPADDSPFILARSARMELLKAYCLAGQGRAGAALSSVDRVRGRIYLDDTDDSMMPEDDDEAQIWVEDIIMQELSYETGFEGQRWFDLMRIAKRRNDPSYLADKVAQKYPEESREEIREKLMDEKNWYIPIFE